ncbi:MAG TPA: DUF4349 domain-containing protein [Nocardioides sp.]|uniref:DUF4349 domain-containing protein n=1 Tax=Nocardioides sp. TaxID=35761 RepID=UPI002E33D602|nr:DUF4349 domain-containing protein [Nocardioides sp.]HEX5089233.1 DUF4349 domain-containing protein [Nocardioides sp.]
MLAAGAASVLVLLSSCSSSGGGDAGSSSSDVAARDAAGGANQAQADSAVAPVAGAPGEDGSQAAYTGTGVQQQKVISTGNVQLRSDDVGQAIFDVRKVVDEYAGAIAEDNTETDKAGVPLRSRMVVRVPTADFDHAMTELEKVGTLVSSKRQSQDVTTQVLDMDARVEAQRRSIERIQVLFDSATSIKDVMSIESELSRRQADLESLESQQRYLADQTSMSTITLSVERTSKARPQSKADHDDTGFLSGLAGGWGAMKSFLVGASTVAGALLPWLVLALVLVVPGWPLARRLRRRTATP